MVDNLSVYWSGEAKEALLLGLDRLNIPPLSSMQEDKFALYAELLLSYNKKVNLTAIRDPVQVAIKHFLDSLSILRVLDNPQSFSLEYLRCRTKKQPCKILDIGSGGGFPGVPLLIARPKLQVTLLDSQAKKLVFLKQLLIALDQKAELALGRAEEMAHQPEYRASFDIVVARAVASLPMLIELSVPFLQQGGFFIAQKGAAYREELAEAAATLKLLGAAYITSEEFELPFPDGSVEKRALLLFQKEKATSDEYPRSPKRIKKALS